MVGTKSRGYSNSGRFSEGGYSMSFFCTRHSPICNDNPQQNSFIKYFRGLNLCILWKFISIANDNHILFTLKIHVISYNNIGILLNLTLNFVL